MAENGTVAYVDKLPECDICKTTGNDSEKESPAAALYDLKTKDGRWAFTCAEHRKTEAYYTTLGTGMGQLLQVRL